MTTSAEERATIARSILDAIDYAVLATADAEGRPWASPVFCVHVGYRRLLWVSRPGAVHSRNLAERPELSMVVFDSTVAPYTGQAVYMRGRAALVPDADLDAAVAAFDGGADEWSRAEVTPPAELRLYAAEVEAHHILDPDVPTDTRVAVEP